MLSKTKLYIEKKRLGIEEGTYEDFKVNVLNEKYKDQYKETILEKYARASAQMQEMVNAQRVKELRDAELENIKVEKQKDTSGQLKQTNITGVPSVEVTAKPVVSYDPITNTATYARQSGGPLVQNLRAFNTSVKTHDYRHPTLGESVNENKASKLSEDDLKMLTKHFNHFTDIAGSGQGDFLSKFQKKDFQDHANEVKKMPSDLHKHFYNRIQDHVNDESNHYTDEDKNFLLQTYAKNHLVKENQHYCAKHVFSDLYGEGIVVEGNHADPDEFGNIRWYTVEFAHGPEQVYTEDVQIMMAEYHGNHSSSGTKKKKQKKVM